MADARDIETIKAESSKLLDEARRAGYAEGYRDAVRNIVAAATDAAPTIATAPTTPSGSVMPPITLRKSTSRAPWGISRHAINKAFDESTRHGGGIDFADALSAAKKLDQRVAESSVRTMINQMAKNDEIKRRGDGLWHRIISRPENTTTRPAETDRAVENTNDGDQKWTSHPDELPGSPRVTDLRPGLSEGRATREASEPPTRMVGT